jgi:hypothetical protein
MPPAIVETFEQPFDHCIHDIWGACCASRVTRTHPFGRRNSASACALPPGGSAQWRPLSGVAVQERGGEPRVYGENSERSCRQGLCYLGMWRGPDGRRGSATHVESGRSASRAAQRTTKFDRGVINMILSAT